MITLHRKLVTECAIDPPLAVTQAELEAQSRASGQDAEQLLPYLYAAQEYLETITNRKFLRQTWAAYLDCFPACDAIRLPFAPLVEVDHVKYTPAGGSLTTLATTVYGVSIVRDPGEIILKYEQSWPTDTLSPIDPIEIQFKCGWAGAATVPHQIRQAIRLLAAHWYANRETVVVDNGMPSSMEIPFGVTALVANWIIR
jgi:uncharacterized phiE125 gp8 family phage protein